MPIILIVIAAVLFLTAYNNNLSALGTELETDIAGWLKWGVAIAAIGVLGKIPKFEKPAYALLILVLLVLVISNHSQLFANLQALSITQPAAAPATPAATTPAPAPGPGVELTGGTTAANTNTTATTTGANTGPLSLLPTLGQSFGL